MSSLLSRAEAGFKTIDLSDGIKQAALANLEDWLENDKFAGLIANLALVLNLPFQRVKPASIG